MPCFCTVPAASFVNSFSPRIVPILPSVPLTMQFAAALPMLDPGARMDMQIDTGMNAMVLPNMELFGGSGGLMQFAATLSMINGSFAIDALPKLEFEMQQAAASFNNNIWPRLSFLPKFSMQPLINFAIVARLVIDLEALGIDPFTIGDFPTPPTGLPAHKFAFRLSPPKLMMARLLAGLPNLLTLSETLDIPPIGDPEMMSAMNNRFSAMAQLPIPRLVVQMPVILKMAMVMESLATIQEAFGPDGFSPARVGQIRAMMRLWSSFPIPIPLPALALKQKLDLLPPMEDIRLGEEMAGSSSFSSMIPHLSMTPPKLAMIPFLNVMMALSSSMEMLMDMPPFDICSMCNCA